MWRFYQSDRGFWPIDQSLPDKEARKLPYTDSYHFTTFVNEKLAKIVEHWFYAFDNNFARQCIKTKKQKCLKRKLQKCKPFDKSCKSGVRKQCKQKAKKRCLS